MKLEPLNISELPLPTEVTSLLSKYISPSMLKASVMALPVKVASQGTFHFPHNPLKHPSLLSSP